MDSLQRTFLAARLVAGNVSRGEDIFVRVPGEDVLARVGKDWRSCYVAFGGAEGSETGC